MPSNRRIIVLLGMVLSIIAFVTLESVVSIRQAQGYDNQGSIRNETLDQNQTPIAEYAENQPQDPMERAKRRARGAKYDKSQWHVNFEDTSDNTVLVDNTDPNLPAFPFTESSAVVLANITGAKAYLSNDRTGIYTEFTASVAEVLKTNPQTLLCIGSRIEIAREGGFLRFPSGRVHLYKVSGQAMPRIGEQYVLFLTGNNDQGFSVLTGYELQNGKVLPLDTLPKAQSYKNADQARFLEGLRIQAATPKSPQ